MSGTVIISLIGTFVVMLVTVGGLFITVGGLKKKIHDSIETNKAQEEYIKTLASKDELGKAIERSDELLVLMQKRVDEDRLSGERRYADLYGLLNVHTERIGKLEVSQEQIFKLLDNLYASINNGFKDMKEDIRELRKAIKKE